MRIDTPDPRPRESGDYDIYVGKGYGDPTATIFLDEKRELILRQVSLEDCERLIKAAALSAEKIRVQRAQMVAPHGRDHLYEGRCQLCGKPEGDELHAEPKPVCRSCEIEPATEGDFCEACAPAALLADSIATGTPLLVTDDDASVTA